MPLDPRPPEHGGPDALGVPLHDFSTNSNAAGPCPQALAAVQQAHATTYPDPSYTALRQRLATWHGVAPERVVLTASASEAMFRLAAAARRVHGDEGRQRGGAGTELRTWMPDAHYADVARACAAWGLERTREPAQATLLWACEPATPSGAAHAGLAAQVQALKPPQTLVLDCAYAPLRLSGQPSLDPQALARVWQLWSPNKALGLTGVRGAYLLAPAEATPQRQAWLAALGALAPSWPLGAHAVALLDAWCQPEVQAWVHTSLGQLTGWKRLQLAALHARGWITLPSDANFLLARPPEAWLQQRPLADLLAHWRTAHGVKLRDATSFGHPGWVRLGVRPPTSIWETLSCP